MNKHRWSRSAAAAALLLTGGLAACTSRGAEENQPPAASASPQPATSLPASCLPTVTEIGFTADEREVRYGVATRNACPYALVNAAVTVRVLGADGRRLAGEDIDLPDLTVLLPGQELAGAGYFQLDDAVRVGTVEAVFTAGEPAPAEAFAAWPREVRVADLTVSTPDSHGRSAVTGRIVTEPAGAALCSPAASLILRDRAGKIVYGRPALIRGDRVSIDLAVPETADPARTEIAVAQGQDALRANPVPVAACAV
ncbi:hypothetical protein [Actinoplanes philippinensis]|uniref:hypothetical protein n=1 Tax=Actinoplanes philippinensis TaxID=35752 RepID=UPI00340E4A81